MTLSAGDGGSRSMSDAVRREFPGAVEITDQPDGQKDVQGWKIRFAILKLKADFQAGETATIISPSELNEFASLQEKCKIERLTEQEVFDEAQSCPSVQEEYDRLYGDDGVAQRLADGGE